MDPVVIGEALAVLMFLGTIGMVLVGFPVAFTLAGTAILFAAAGSALGVFDFSYFHALPNRVFGIMINEVLVAVPLFIFMGMMLERSRIAETLLTTMGELFGPLRGGLGISVIIVGTLLAASTGIVGATVVTMGLLSLPAMMRAGYDPKLAAGVICASGTLGQIIPPSTVLIFMGDMLQSSNQAAHNAVGDLTPEPVSIGDLFAGAVFPGFVLVGLYILWVIFKAITAPSSCPPVEAPKDDERHLILRVLVALVPPLVLIVLVLGSILSGTASATESASVGAIGAMVLAIGRRQFNLRILLDVMRSTMTITSMVFIILAGASVFSLVFRGLGGEHLVAEVLAGLPGGMVGAVIAVMAVMFILGFFLDTFEIIFVVVPITAAALIVLGVNPIWLGVMIGMNLQTSFLTPPFGFALFYLRGVASKAVTTMQIYRGAVPFVGLQIIAMVILWFVPGLATWLPDQIYNKGQPRTYLAGRDVSGENSGASQYQGSDQPFELPIDNSSVFDLNSEGGGMFGEGGGDETNMFNDAPAGNTGPSETEMFNDPPAGDSNQ
ncbi:MAG: TRAP transporter large permease subunit [Sneathiellaceae bacterium]